MSEISEQLDRLEETYMVMLDKKDAEIERLKEENSALENQVVEYAGQLLENDAEITRLKQALGSYIP
jgi:chromosome segregation ATPase